MSYPALEKEPPLLCSCLIPYFCTCATSVNLLPTVIEEEQQSLLPTTVMPTLSYLDTFIEFIRSNAAWLAHSKLCWLSSFASGFIGWFQGVYSSMAITGLVACYNTEWTKVDNGYDYLYISLLAAWSILYTPAAFYEQWRKNYKYIANGGLGNLKEHYAPSSNGLKKFNMGTQIMGTAFVGGDFGAAIMQTSVANPGTLACLKEAWSLDYKQGLMVSSGAVIAFGLAGPQMASFFGRRQPFYGSIGTAFTYMIYKVASTFYPIFKTQMKTHWNNPIQLVLTFASLIVVAMNRFKVYHRANQVLEIVYTYQNNEEAKALNTRITTLKTAQAGSSRAGAIKTTINKLEAELKKAETSKSEIVRIRQSQAINDAMKNGFEASSFGSKLFGLLLPCMGSLSLAYITTQSLLDVFSAFGVPTENPWCKVVLYIVSGHYGFGRFFRFFTSFLGNKIVPDEAFNKLASTEKEKLDRIEKRFNDAVAISEVESSESVA